ncbi:hypothetical protein [Spirosoma aerolatum]|uniref:hypothetical protein n=1 Tax=Spirosoma aerolatum TaxID=1211326 RepID=UPI001FE6F504|nr:hypothetical protein [Spirosoma aerolatum]
MKKLVLLLSVWVAMVGCMPTIQVVTLRGSNVSPSQEGLAMDNDTLTLRYNFASERGLMQLSIVNKLNKPLYVDWKRSSFIIGQDKVDYWSDVSDVHLSGSASRYSRYASSVYLGGTIKKQEPIAFIPPQTKLEKKQFVVVPQGSVRLTGPSTIEQEKAKWTDRKKPVDIVNYAYSADQSPLTFRNYLTLSTDKDFKTEFTIDTKFWASDVKVLPRDQILTQQTSTTYDGRGYYIPAVFKQPDAFYVQLPTQ